MGSQLLDLVAQKQADTQRTGNDARTIEEKIPWFYAPQQGIRSTLVQVRYREIRLAGKYRQWNEKVCGHHQQQSHHYSVSHSHSALS